MENGILHHTHTHTHTDIDRFSWAWQAVALLPFIDAERLLAVTSELEPLLTLEECHRNSQGSLVICSTLSMLRLIT